MSRTKVYGPFDILSLNSLSEGQVVLTLPYAEVQGAQLLSSVTQTNPNGIINDTQSFAAFEVGYWGSFQGFQSLIKRAAIRSLTGPMSYLFDFEESYDQVIVKVRNMSGGRRGPPPAGVVTAFNNCLATLNIFIQPRSGTGNFSHRGQER